MTLDEAYKNHKWSVVAQIMASQGVHKTNVQWRTLWRLENDDKYKKGLKQGMHKRDDKRAGRFANEERLLGAIKTKKRLEYLEERLGLSGDEILSVAMRLCLNGYNVKVWNENEAVWLYNVPILETGDAQIKNLQTASTIKIAIIGDTHLGSKTEAINELRTFYEYAHSKGVSEFYHVGDISDGYYKNRDGSIFEQHKIGFQDQLDYIIDNYPRIDDCTTYMISGNHDATHINNGGANIGKCLERARTDIIYLGHNFAKIWLTNKLDMNLLHPADGVSQALSAKAQKIVDNATGKRKAKIMCIGHYHKANYAPYKGTHTLLVPSFQWQTSFMAVNNLISIVGGYILTIKVNKDGEIVSFTPEFFEFEERCGE